MPENEMTETQEMTIPTETRREKFERERLSRRAALKKMGVTTAMSVLAMFSVDDLARMAGKAMKQHTKDNQIAEVVAKELRQAGVALAGAGSTTGDQPPFPIQIGILCNGNNNTYGPAKDCMSCVTNGCNKYHPGTAANQICMTNGDQECKS